MTAIDIIGVVGAGAMGRGIAELAARQGFAVRLTDTRDGAADAALDAIGGALRRDVEKGRLAAPETAAIQGRLATATLVDVAAADLVIEAIVEDLAAKRALFAAIEAAARPDALLATNTSSLSVARIGEGLGHPGRFAGMHFFNPPTRMQMVEIVRAPATNDDTIAALRGVADRLGRHAVVVGDTPGFLVNHLGRGMTGEALRILDDGAAEPAALDAIATGALGFRMGPCALLDLVGLDVSLAASEQIWRGFGEEPRFRPAPVARARVAAGLLGRKSGRGFYAYDTDGKAIAEDSEVDSAEPVAVRLVGAAAEIGGLFPPALVADDPSAVPVVAPLGTDVAAEAQRHGLAPGASVAVDPVFADVVTVAAADPALAARVAATIRAGGRAAVTARGNGGMPAQRLAAMIVLVAADAAGRGLAPPAEIDMAARLALGYPRGPLALGDAVGPARIAAIAAGLHALTGDPRWRPSPWLDARIAAGAKLTGPSGGDDHPPHEREKD